MVCYGWWPTRPSETLVKNINITDTHYYISMILPTYPGKIPQTSPKPNKERKSFINCWWNIRGPIFQGMNIADEKFILQYDFPYPWIGASLEVMVFHRDRSGVKGLWLFNLEYPPGNWYISHLGKRKIIFKYAGNQGDMLIPWRGIKMIPWLTWQMLLPLQENTNGLRNGFSMYELLSSLNELTNIKFAVGFWWYPFEVRTHRLWISFILFQTCWYNTHSFTPRWGFKIWPKISSSFATLPFFCGKVW